MLRWPFEIDPELRTDAEVAGEARRRALVIERRSVQDFS
jgi:hypothetical protein